MALEPEYDLIFYIPPGNRFDAFIEAPTEKGAAFIAAHPNYKRLLIEGKLISMIQSEGLRSDVALKYPEDMAPYFNRS